MTLVHEEKTYQILGACFEVCREKGCGFSEPVFQECMELELGFRRIPFVAQPRLELEYKGLRLNQSFLPDLICYDQIIVELKALAELKNEHRAQLHNYVKASGYRVGLLVNFGHYPALHYERIIR